MSEQTPSQAEGDRDGFASGESVPDDSQAGHRSHEPPRTTPSQAEGEQEKETEPGEAGKGQPPTDERDRYARALSDEEPGAHSGGESPARERVVPGTASAAEGYPSQGGTTHGEPLAGVERTEGGENPGLITRDHVRELLTVRDDSPVLVLLEGRARVVSAENLRSDRYAGAVEIMSGEELIRRAGQDSYSEQDLDALAARLETMISNLGG